MCFHIESRFCSLFILSVTNPEKEGFQTGVIRSGKSSQPDVRIIRVEDGGSGPRGREAVKGWLLHG